MKRFTILGAVLAAFTLVSTAFAITGEDALPLLWGQTHDGISFNAVSNTMVVKSPGTAARRGSLTDFFTVTRGSSGFARAQSGLLVSYGNNVPRFEYDFNNNAQGLLIEPAATNLALQSQTLDNASWIKANANVTANTDTAPDGTVTMDTITEDGALAVHGVLAGITVSAGGTYTLSAYVKASGRTFAYLYGTNVDQYGAIFNLSTGAMGDILAGTGSVTDKGIIAYGNGVYRIWVSGVMNGSGTVLNFVAGPAISLSNPAGYNYTGDGVSAVKMWGLQVEAGAAPTSYIPTVAAQASRSADVITRTVGTEFNPLAGTTITTYDTSLVTSSPTVWAVDDGTNNNNIQGYHSSSTLYALINTGGGSQCLTNASGTVVNGTRYKGATAWATNSCVSVRAGNVATEDTTVNVPTVTTMRLGSATATATLNGHILGFDYYPVRIANGTLVMRTQP